MCKGERFYYLFPLGFSANAQGTMWNAGDQQPSSTVCKANTLTTVAIAPTLNYSELVKGYTTTYHFQFLLENNWINNCNHFHGQVVTVCRAHPAEFRAFPGYMPKNSPLAVTCKASTLISVLLFYPRIDTFKKYQVQMRDRRDGKD